MKEKSIPCPVCRKDLTIRLAQGRKSGKPFVMLICPQDGRHIRAFINDREFVGSILSKLQNTDHTVKDDAVQPSEDSLEKIIGQTP